MESNELKTWAKLILEREMEEDLAYLDEELNKPLSPELLTLKKELLEDEG